MSSGLHIYLRFGAPFSEEELKTAGLSAWEDGLDHPEVEMSRVSEDIYLWVSKSHHTIHGPTTDHYNRTEALLDLQSDGESKLPHKDSFHLACSEYGLPDREPKWFLVYIQD